MKNTKILLLVFVTLFLLSGCTDDKHYDEVRKKALSYYKEKYGLKDIEITDSTVAGNSGLFGYLDVKDRAYQMSDGYFVYWNDQKQYFADNRQAEQIRKDFDEKILSALTDLENVRVSSYDLNRSAMESFDECIFTGLYDGDIETFLKKEKPRPYNFRITIRAEEGFDHEAYTEKIYEQLNRYLSGSIDVVIVEHDSGLFEESDNRYIRNGDPGVVANASLYFDDMIYWHRQVYIEIFDGVYLTSSEANFDLQEGDVRLVEAGPSSQFQQILDDSYHSLPVDAEENKNGGYMAHDQRHESRIVLDTTEQPYYRLELSDRVRENLKDGKLSVYIHMNREGSLPLYVRYGYGNADWKLFQVCDTDGSVKYDTLHIDNLYYFGNFHYEEYSD